MQRKYTNTSDWREELINIGQTKKVKERPPNKLWMEVIREDIYSRS